jgi:hypothetical protein
MNHKIKRQNIGCNKVSAYAHSGLVIPSGFQRLQFLPPCLDEICGTEMYMFTTPTLLLHIMY